MSERVIPLVDQRIASLAAPVPAQPIVADGLLSDALGRPLSDLRISVTDRCNFRCNYCMPKEVFDKDYPYLPHGALLSFEEITRTAKLFVAHGVRKIRLTGGEPLLRKNIEVLIEQLAALRTPDGQPLDLTLTTNGSLLARKAKIAQGGGLEAGDREPGRAGRRGVPRDERRGLSRGRRAGRHRGRARSRAGFG
jgi:cyclic pyranopterin phosphate synthase